MAAESKHLGVPDGSTLVWPAQPTLPPRKGAPSSLPTRRVESTHAAPPGYEGTGRSSRSSSSLSSYSTLSLVSSDFDTALAVQGDRTSTPLGTDALQDRHTILETCLPSPPGGNFAWGGRRGATTKRNPRLAEISQEGLRRSELLSDVPSTLPPSYNES